MKKSILVLSIAMTCFMSASAFARSMRPLNMSADLLRWTIDKDWSEAQNVYGGKIQVDVVSQKATLTLKSAFSCPAGRICRQSMPPELTIELPLVKRFTDSCGSHNYVASRDQRPAHGAFRELVITDNTGNRCPSFMARAATEISYIEKAYSWDAFQPNREIEYVSTFEAKRLEAASPR